GDGLPRRPRRRPCGARAGTARGRRLAQPDRDRRDDLARGHLRRHHLAARQGRLAAPPLTRPPPPSPARPLRYHCGGAHLIKHPDPPARRASVELERTAYSQRAARAALTIALIVLGVWVLHRFLPAL